MVLLGAVPSGATSNFQVWQPGFILGYLGGYSAIGRAFARGDARTVAVLLFCAPNIVLSGTAWKQAHIHTRHDLIRWIVETLQHDPEIVEHAMLTRARSAMITPVLNIDRDDDPGPLGRPLSDGMSEGEGFEKMNETALVVVLPGARKDCLRRELHLHQAPGAIKGICVWRRNLMA